VSARPTSVRIVVGAGVFLAVAVAASTALVRAQQMATVDRVQMAGFWPTKEAPRADFLGPAACTRCHAAHAETQPASSMARTMMRVADAATLRENPSLSFRAGAYTYAVRTTDGQSVYTVTGPADAAASAPLTWAFGAGSVGQTYLFERDGAVQESRLSYFQTLGGADFTPGRELPAPKDVQEAFSRRVPPDETRRCFACHTTATTAGGKVDTANLIPGITCEACHGPGRRHVELVEQKKLGPALDAILNPARLDPGSSVDFCGACHATFWDIMLARDTGVVALRSQPNRLQSSRCWGRGDARITCVACHDPHAPLVTDAASYDSKCLGCHVQAPAAKTADRPGPGCPVARERCVTCHMPSYEAPGMHHLFTDHLIRVVKKTG
jgi:cytochrome c554/c'-like protein